MLPWKPAHQLCGRMVDVGPSFCFVKQVQQNLEGVRSFNPLLQKAQEQACDSTVSTDLRGGAGWWH